MHIAIRYKGGRLFDLTRRLAAGLPFTYSLGYFENEIKKFMYQIIDFS